PVRSQDSSDSDVVMEDVDSSSSDESSDESMNDNIQMTSDTSNHSKLPGMLTDKLEVDQKVESALKHLILRTLNGMAGGSSNKPSKALPNKKKNARFGKARTGKGSGSGSQTNPQRTRFHAIVHGRGLVVLTALKEATNTQSFTGDLTRAIDDDDSFCEDQMCLGSFPLRCAISGEVKTFKTSNNRIFAQKCFVFSVDSDEEVIKKVQIVCDLFSRVTKPYVSKTGVTGRPHLGVPGKITGSVESADLPEIITSVGDSSYCGMSSPDFTMGSFWREDTGLKMGSGVAENDEEEQDKDQGWGADMKDRDKGC
ncbi:hypothetical protein THAOC_10936, partial [Thalassiosira oceanica]